MIQGPLQKSSRGWGGEEHIRIRLIDPTLRWEVHVGTSRHSEEDSGRRPHPSGIFREKALAKRNGLGRASGLTVVTVTAESTEALLYVGCT